MKKSGIVSSPSKKKSTIFRYTKLLRLYVKLTYVFYEGRLKSSWTGGSALLLCRGRFKRTLFRMAEQLRGPFEKFVDSLYYSVYVFEKWVQRCKKCIACQGRDFQKETVTAPPQSSDLE
jgi:hypothetical protein